jgi:small GTP-binding protein
MAKDLKLVAVGDGAVGKTSLLNVLNGKPFQEDYVPTIFERYTQNADILGVPYNLDIRDTASEDDVGQTLCRRMSYCDANVILLCFALDSKQSFVNLTNRWTDELKNRSSMLKVILIGTKKDLRQEGNANHVTDDEARGFVSEQKYDLFIPCSPKSGEGVGEVFPAAAKGCNTKEKGGCQLL